MIHKALECGNSFGFAHKTLDRCHWGERNKVINTDIIGSGVTYTCQLCQIVPLSQKHWPVVLIL